MESLEFVSSDQKNYIESENNELSLILHRLKSAGFLSDEETFSLEKSIKDGVPLVFPPRGKNEREDIFCKLDITTRLTREAVSNVLGNELVVKYESENLFGSHYDRIYKVLLQKYLEKYPGRNAVLEISSGSAGVSVAGMSSLLGIDTKLIIPESDFPIRYTLPQRLGAHVILSPKDEGVCGANKVLQNIWKEELRGPQKRVFLNHSERDDTLPAMTEIADEVGAVDYFFSAMGNGTTLRGIGERLKFLNPNTKIIGVRYKNANRSESLQVPGGDDIDIKFPHLREFKPDEVLWLPLDEVKNKASKENLGFTSMMVKLGAQSYLSQNRIEGKRVLLIDYDSGGRY